MRANYQSMPNRLPTDARSGTGRLNIRVAASFAKTGSQRRDYAGSAQLYFAIPS